MGLKMRVSSSLLLIVLTTVLAAPCVHAQDDGDERYEMMVGNVPFLQEHDDVLTYFSDVISGQVQVSPEAKLRAHFWRGETQYRNKLMAGAETRNLDFHANAGSSIFDEFADFIQYYSVNDRFRQGALAKMAWCHFRQSEITTGEDSRDELIALLVFLRNNSGEIQQFDEPIKFLIDYLGVYAKLRLVEMSPSRSAAPVDLQTLNAEIQAVDGLSDEIKFYLVAQATLAFAILDGRGATSEASSFDSVGAAVSQLLDNFPSVGQNPELRGAVGTLQTIADLSALSVADEFEPSMLLDQFQLAAAGPVDAEMLGLAASYAFLKIFDQSMIQKAGIPLTLDQQMDQLDPDSSPYAEECQYWLGWANYLKTIQLDDVDCLGADQFLSFIENDLVELPDNNRSVALDNRWDLMAVEACYRLADIYFQNKQFDEAMRWFAEIDRLNWPHSVDVIKKKAICSAGNMSSDDIDSTLPELYYFLKQQSLTTNQRFDTALGLAFSLFQRGMAENEESYFLLSRAVIATLVPGFDDNIRYTRYIPPGSSSTFEDVRIRIEDGSTEHFRLMFLDVINIISIASFNMRDATTYLQEAETILRDLSSSEYSDEIQYVRGMIKSTMARFVSGTDRVEYDEQALEIFHNLLSKNSYVAPRALLRIGMTLDQLNADDQAKKCFQYLLDLFGGAGLQQDFVYKKSSYGLRGASATIEDGSISYSGQTTEINFNLNDVQYYAPDENRIYYESIRSRSFEFASIVDNFLSNWRQVYLPQLYVYPSRNRIEGAVSQSFSSSTGAWSGIGDEFFLTDSLLQFVFAFCNATEANPAGGTRIHLTGNTRYKGRSVPVDTMFTLQNAATSAFPGGSEPFEFRLPMGASVESLIFTVPSRYTYCFDRRVKDEAQIFHCFAEVISSYDADVASGDLPVGVIDHEDNTIFCSPAIEEKVTRILEHEQTIYLRDFAMKKGNAEVALAADSRQNAVVQFNMNDQVSVFAQQYGEGRRLNSPEGIARDKDGNFYVTDWGNHCVVRFDENGNYEFHFGSEGVNTESNAGVGAKFEFPTRIAIERPDEGSAADEHLLVADRNGIHKIDLSGHYLDTVVSVGGSAGFKEWEFYGIECEGYGADASVYLVKREDDTIWRFRPRNR